MNFIGIDLSLNSTAVFIQTVSNSFNKNVILSFTNKKDNNIYIKELERKGVKFFFSPEKKSDIYSKIEDTYVLLPNQDGKIKIENFQGKGETKVIEIGNNAKWFAGVAMTDAQLDKYGAREVFKDPKAIAALKSAHKLTDLEIENIRGACPLDAKNAHHCGNVPTFQEGDIFLILKENGKKNGKTVASIVIDSKGNVVESKGNFNKSIDKEYNNNMVWLYNEKYVTGNLGAWDRYDASVNFWMYKHDDEDVQNHFYDNSGKNFDDTEKTVKDLRTKYKNG